MHWDEMKIVSLGIHTCTLAITNIEKRIFLAMYKTTDVTRGAAFAF